MDNSFYGLSGYEPWQIEKSADGIVSVILYAHLCYVGGAIKPAERIKELITVQRSNGMRISHSIGGPHGDVAEDIVYNLKKFWEKENGVES